MLKEFKEFAIRGNAMDLAVGVIIGAAFTSVVNSIVNDLLNPILNMFVGNVDFRSFVIGLPGKEVLKVGSFITASINFLIVAFAVFLLVKQINRFRTKTSSTTKECPYCLNLISIKATRCQHCTSAI